MVGGGEGVGGWGGWLTLSFISFAQLFLSFSFFNELIWKDCEVTSQPVGKETVVKRLRIRIRWVCHPGPSLIRFGFWHTFWQKGSAELSERSELSSCCLWAWVSVPEKDNERGSRNSESREMIPTSLSQPLGYLKAMTKYGRVLGLDQTCPKREELLP